MALPLALNDDAPAGGDAPSTIDNRIRETRDFLLSVLGIADDATIETAISSVSTDGLSYLIFSDEAADAGAAGRLQRNGADLTFHDGTAARDITFVASTQTLTNKTLTSPTLNTADINDSTLDDCVVQTQIFFPNGSTATPPIAADSNTDLGVYFAAGGIHIAHDGTDYARIGSGPGGIGLGTGQLVWGSAVTSNEIVLTRDTANALAQQNSTTAQTFLVYNTRTDASNYERAAITWVTNVLKIGTQNAGTGSARALTFVTGGTDQWQINTTGNLVNVAANVGIVPGAVSGTPAQHALFRENVVKGYLNTTGGGTPSIEDSFNVAGVVDADTGNMDVTWDRDFSTAAYSVVAIPDVSGGTLGFTTSVADLLVGTATIHTANSTSAAAADPPTGVHVIAIGDQ